MRGRGAGRRGARTREEGGGKGLEPYDLAEPRRLGRFNPRYIPLLGGSPTGRTAHVEAPVSGNAVEPGAKRGPSFQPSKPLPAAEQRVFHAVLGILEGSNHT